MLHTRKDNVVAPFERAEYRDIERLGAIFGKHHPVKPVPVKEIGECISSLLHDICARKSKFMPTSSGICTYFYCRGNGGEHGIGFSTARRGVVEINHNAPLFFRYT